MESNSSEELMQQRPARMKTKQKRCQLYNKAMEGFRNFKPDVKGIQMKDVVEEGSTLSKIGYPESGEPLWPIASTGYDGVPDEPVPKFELSDEVD
jgi:hypothetical protein